MLKHLVYFALAANALILNTSLAAAQDRAIEKRPWVGFVLVAWDEASKANPRAWERSIQQIADLGMRDVTVVTYRFVDAATGKIRSSSVYGLDSPPSDDVVRAALRQGKRLGVRVTLNPLVEIDNPDDLGGEWRGDLNFTGARLDTFFENYGEYIRGMAQLIHESDGHRLYVGSELKSLVTNRDAQRHWSELIRNTRQQLPPPVKLSYAANFDNAGRVPFWSELDEIGIDAYYGLAKSSAAKGPSKPSIDTIKDGWRVPLEQSRKLSQRYQKPVVFSEWGVVPFDLTTVHPWDWMPTKKKDPQEQLHAYQATLAVIESEGEWLNGITCWHWAMPGNQGSHYRIDPDSNIVQQIENYARRP